MAILKVSVKSDNSNVGNKQYQNKINADNFREISLILTDLRNIGLPIDKAVSDYKLKKSDWDAALGF
jgi:hypothetical protein